MSIISMLKPITDRIEGLEIHEEAKREILLDMAALQQSVAKRVLFLQKALVGVAIFSLVFPIILKVL